MPSWVFQHAVLYILRKVRKIAAVGRFSRFGFICSRNILMRLLNMSNSEVIIEKPNAQFALLGCLTRDFEVTTYVEDFLLSLHAFFKPATCCVIECSERFPQKCSYLAFEVFVPCPCDIACVHDDCRPGVQHTPCQR